MSKTRTTAFFSLGEPARYWSRALLGSVVLHGALLAGLVSLRQTTEPAQTATPSVLLVDLVYLRDTGSERGGRVADARALGADPAPRECPAAGVAPARLEPAPAQVAVAAPPPASAESSGPDPESAAPPATQEAAVAEPATGPAPVEVTEPVVEPTLIVRAPSLPADAPDSDAAAEPKPKPEPEVILAAIPDDERRMLDRKLSAWSASMDELAEGDVSWEHDGQAYSATFTRVADDETMGIEHVLVAVTTEQDGNRWSTAMRMKRMAFSSFAQFVDRWDSSVQIHDDEIDGRFHSNSEIYIANSGGVQPAFHGKVTTAKRVNTSSSARRVRREEVFLGGLETGVQRIALPRHFLPFPTDSDLPPERVRRFERETRIVFNADGSYSSQPLDAGEPGQRTPLPDEPFYLLAADDASLYVSGVVRGKVLVYSPADVIVEGNLVYATDPASVPDSGDYLGLVASRNVVIAGPETTGPGDLTVQAAIYAKRRFLVRRYSSAGPATLRVFGSVAAGALSATEPRYRTKLEFDPRLEDARPPGFPMTDRYELVAWDGLWTADPVR